MRITFLGGADEVGASGVVLDIAARRVLVDAGIRMSPKARDGLVGDQLPDLNLIDHGGGVDAVLVTHAHIDHTGALALVAERYPYCPVYATQPTIAFTRILQQDARQIMKSRLEQEGELPLYDSVATDKLMAACVPVAFNMPLNLGSDLVATFYPAGHIAGAAMIGLSSPEGKVLITGDLHVSPQRTVAGAKPPPFSPDVLIMESTYGGRLHANRTAEERRLVEAVTQVVANGGKVLIPAFALGRAQEVLLILSEARRRGQLPDVQIWADGMVRSICQAYTAFVELLPLPLQECCGTFFDDDSKIAPVWTAEQRRDIVWQPGPAVIVASSGMLAGGASLAYAEALAGDERNAILITGYQDEEAPGRRLLQAAAHGPGPLRLGKRIIDVRCRIGVYSLSAHADHGQLVSLVEALFPSQVMLVHGDSEARQSLAHALTERGRRTVLPHGGQTLEVPVTRPAAKPPGTVSAGAVSSQPAERPLSVNELWQRLAAAGGGVLSASTIAGAWWGEAAPEHVEDLTRVLARDDLYFCPVSGGSRYRVRSLAEVELARRRRGLVAAWGDLAGQWVVARDAGAAVLVGRCVAAGSDHIMVATAPGAGQSGETSLPIWPEDVLEVLGPSDIWPDQAVIEETIAGAQLNRAFRLAAMFDTDAPRPLEALLADLPQPSTPTAKLMLKAALSVSLLRAGARLTPEGYVLSRAHLRAMIMEPNQALACVREKIPPAARLQRCGYRATAGSETLLLTFDFPELARRDYAEVLADVAQTTGWQIEVNRHPNHAALGALARQVLPAGWRVVKEPSIHLQQGRVEIKVRSPAGYQATAGAPDDSPEVRAAMQEFAAVSGYELVVVTTDQPAPEWAGSDTAATAWEINAAYAAIQEALAETTLYRTSLKGGEIVLSFISPQMGQRHAAQIAALSSRVGWRLHINPQPNQGAILDAARAIIAEAGLSIQKGPGIVVERGEVAVTLSAVPSPSEQRHLEDAFNARTGYRLLINQPVAAAAALPAAPQQTVDIRLERIRLGRMHQNIELNPAKLETIIVRLRQAGQCAPIIVRRITDGYVLVDGLYRLTAARELGWEQLPAIVE